MKTQIATCFPQMNDPGSLIRTAQQLWSDSSGSILTTELVLLSSLVVAGALTVGGRVRTAVSEQVGELVNSVNIQPNQPKIEPAPVFTNECLILQD